MGKLLYKRTWRGGRDQLHRFLCENKSEQSLYSRESQKISFQGPYRWGLLNDLLMSPLHAAVSFKQVHGIAMVITKYLDFHMPI